MSYLDKSMIKAQNDAINSDWELFISKGSENAFTKIYNDHFDLLFNLGLKYSTDQQIIEDSIQNLFSYLLRKRKKLTSVSNLKSYLIRSFRNQLFNDLKKHKKLYFPDQITETQIEHYNSTEQTIIDIEEQNEIEATLKKCINKLTKKQKELIYLRFDCELSYNEISDILEITVDSCYKSTYRIIKFIKEEIDKRNIKRKDFYLWFIFRLQHSP